MNQFTPRHRLSSHSASEFIPQKLISQDHLGQDHDQNSSQHRPIDTIPLETRREAALDLVLSEALSDQVSGVESLRELAALGDSESAHLLAEVARGARAVVAHLQLNADRLLTWAADLGHPEARFYFAMRCLDGTDEEQREGVAQLHDLAKGGFKEAVAFMRSMKATL